jgi:DNA ligase D-like protein (predicted 3'-phosphoesterase)
MKLKEYRAKRNFAKTSEPPESGEKRTDGGLIYVIQKHNASRLHYDLRLEENGVLTSWAVPKTPPLNEGEKRLAVQTEDHPIDYAGFEGVIPEGEYGAGTVEIWDKGTYEPVEITAEKKIVNIHGGKLNGRYALIKLKPRGKEKDVNWLFFKTK